MKNFSYLFYLIVTLIEVKKVPLLLYYNTTLNIFAL